ncbi:ATP-binding cassette domain-containing protein [Micromonospora zamorensis]|uniref:ATP-binding cassette domain-containing protein n=1 Tax=Micromonospora zamorensis TaxID=709883 RepID=UPI003CE798D6
MRQDDHSAYSARPDPARRRADVAARARGARRAARRRRPGRRDRGEPAVLPALLGTGHAVPAGRCRRVPATRVDEVLELVGLRDRSGERVKTYSLGMKQRLAVASALLKNPKLLILDEPANGLDPGGIREMRTLMRTLAESGMTVVLSSHILGEIQLICDSVTIISLGRRVAFGPVDEVLAQHSSSAVRIRLEAVSDLPAATEALTRAGIQVTGHPDHLMLTGVDKPASVTRLLAEQNLYVSELAPIAVDLESVFLELTATAPVPGQHRQVDESMKVGGAGQPGPAGGGWGA